MGYRDNWKGDSERPPRKEREKKSWRDIDNARDSSYHRKDEHDRLREKASRGTGYSRYKSDLEALFNKGQVSETIQNRMGDKLKEMGAQGDTPGGRVAAIRLIKSAPSLEERNRAWDSFVKAGHELPDDMDLLTSALDHPREDLIRGALERMEVLLDTRPLPRKASLVERLKMLCELADERATETVARRLVNRLSS